MSNIWGRLVKYWAFPSYHLNKLVEFLRHLSASTLPSLAGAWVSRRLVSLETGVTLHLMYVHLGKGQRIKNPDLR